MLGLFRCGETVSRGVPAAASTDVNRWPRPDYCQLLFAAGPFDLMANCFERPAVNRNLLAADRPRSAPPEQPMTQPPSVYATRSYLRQPFPSRRSIHRSIFPSVSRSLNRTTPENQEPRVARARKHWLAREKERKKGKVFSLISSR